MLLNCLPPYLVFASILVLTSPVTGSGGWVMGSLYLYTNNELIGFTPLGIGTSPSSTPIYSMDVNSQSSAPRNACRFSCGRLSISECVNGASNDMTIIRSFIKSSFWYDTSLDFLPKLLYWL